MERIIGTVAKLDPDTGFGYLKVRERPKHRFLLSKAPADIKLLDAVWFTSYPKEPGQQYPLAANIAVIRPPKVAA